MLLLEIRRMSVLLGLSRLLQKGSEITVGSRVAIVGREAHRNLVRYLVMKARCIERNAVLARDLHRLLLHRGLLVVVETLVHPALLLLISCFDLITVDFSDAHIYCRADKSLENYSRF